MRCKGMSNFPEQYLNGLVVLEFLVFVSCGHPPKTPIPNLLAVSRAFLFRKPIVLSISVSLPTSIGSIPTRLGKLVQVNKATSSTS
jgi:hypothetical protein